MINVSEFFIKNKNLFVVSLIYFTILLSIAIFVKDIPVQYANNTFITASEIVKTSQYGDPGTFAKTALQVVEDGWITQKNQWVFNLWPPGFVLLEALIIKIFGTGVAIILVLQVLASILFATVLTLLYILGSKYINKKIAFALPLLLFAFPVSRAFLLEPLGISFGESFSIAFFMLFIMIAIFSNIRSSLKLAMLSGFFLGMAAYFRSNFGAVLSFMILFGMLLIIIFYAYKFIKKEELFDRNIVYQIGTIIFVAFLVSVPWRAYKYSKTGTLKSTMLMYKTLVQPTEKLQKAGAHWVVAGRGNMMCLVDESTCGIKNNNTMLLVKTFLLNPIKWYSIKAEVIGSYWFADTNGRMAVPKKDLSVYGIFYNSIILLLLFIGIFILIKLKKSSIAIFGVWVSLSVYSMYLAVFTVAHYEVRYFYFPKIYIIFIFLLLMIMYFKQKKELNE